MSILKNGDFDRIPTWGALSQIRTIRGDFSITRNTILQDLRGLDSSARIDGHLLLGENEDLVDLKGVK